MRGLTIFVLFCTLSISYGQQVRLGPCPTIRSMTNLEPNKLAGKWYEAASYLSFYELIGKCFTETLRNNSDGTITVRQSNRDIVFSSEFELNATLTPVDKRLGRFNLVIPALNNFQLPLWILGTDYENWAVAHSCVDFIAVHLEFLYIYTRVRNGNIESAKAILNNNNLNESLLTLSDQTCDGN